MPRHIAERTGLSGRLRERLVLTQNIIRETPVVQIADEHLELYAKLEFCNGVGSVKDRPAFWILKRAIERGEIAPSTTIVESSSGNFACALAAFCRILDLKFIPVIDPNIPPLYEAYLRVQCDRVVKVDGLDRTGGFLKTRLRTVQTLLSELPSAYWTNQYENLDAFEAHYRYTGAEICRAVPKLDFAFIGVSSAGTISGVSCRLKEHNPLIRIVAVDTEGSVIFGQTPGKRHISGIGSSIVPPLLKKAVIDDVVIVTERDTVVACHELLQRHQLFVGGSSGTAYSAIRQYFGKPPRASIPRVLFLCSDRGTAYLDNIFNPDWTVCLAREDAPSIGSSTINQR